MTLLGRTGRTSRRGRLLLGEDVGRLTARRLADERGLVAALLLLLLLVLDHR
jgi:hypothetical protein